MFELTMNGQVVQLNFGMGFLREMNKKVSVPVDGMPNVKQDVGCRYNIAKILDGDVEALVDVIDAGNKGCTPRVTRAAIDAFVDDEETNIDQVFDSVLGFLEKANATKKITLAVMEAIENGKAEREAQKQS